MHGAARQLAALRELERRLGVTLPVRLPDGSEHGDGPFRLVLHHDASLRALLWPPDDLTAGEAYVHGDVDVEGDLVAALHLLGRADVVGLTVADRVAIGRRLLALPRPPRRDRSRRARLHGRRHSPARDRDAIRFHYDLGNDFFRLFLDDALVYSCAYFTPQDLAGDVRAGDVALERAQRRKLELVCRKLDLRPGMRMLDVGCGWGSLAIHAARSHGARVVGVTLSDEQADLARHRVAALGLGDRVEIRLADYRELDGSFDAVASVGMVEHVGADELPRYFRRLHRLLRPGGRLLNHGITTGARREVRDLGRASGSFVGTYVFPDGALVPASTMLGHLEDAGFEAADLHQLRPHYARTLRHWVARLEARHDDAVRVASERDFRVWRAYMAGSVVGFESNDLGVVQLLGVSGGQPPVTRTRMVLADDEPRGHREHAVR